MKTVIPNPQTHAAQAPRPKVFLRVLCLLSAVLCPLMWGTASAAGTASGTTISNSVNLSFTVGTVTNNVTSNTASFVVDNKVNLSVVESGDGVTVATPNATDRITTFTVTNLGNTAQGYTLAAANQDGTSAVIGGVADTINVTGLQVFVDGNDNGTYEAGTDLATHISTLAPDASVKVFVLANIPLGATNGQQANITLTATTKTAGLTAVAAAAENYIATATPDTATLDIMFADAATAELAFVGTSAARNAQATARDAYNVVTALISVVKTSTLLCDPFNGTTSPTSIPGAMVRWTITISNASTAATSATLGQALDTLDTNTTFDPNLVEPTSAANCVSAAAGPFLAGGSAGNGFRINVLNDARTVAQGGDIRFFTSTNDTDSAYLDTSGASPAVRIDYGTALPNGGTYTAGELKPGESVVIDFNVTIK